MIKKMIQKINQIKNYIKKIKMNLLKENNQKIVKQKYN